MTEGPRVNFVMREALFEIYTWTLCLSYLHEKQTSRIQSFYLYFIKNCPVLAVKYPLFKTQYIHFGPTVVTLTKLLKYI